jgi:dolichyl-phosphate-mannose-protein mannosyltransferase
MGKPKIRNTSREASVDGPDQIASRDAPKTSKHADYTSEGVEDHDVFLLPSSDYKTIILLTLLAAVVRLFRIQQPSSVVFDEVQYVTLCY